MNRKPAASRRTKAAARRRPAWLAEPFILSGPGSEGFVFGQRCDRRHIQDNPGPDYSKEAFAALFTDRRARELAEAGYTIMVSFSFFRTFSEKAEAWEIGLTKEFFDRCRRRGVRTAVYISDTLNPETLREEYPDVESWAMHNAAGQPVYYGDEYWRLRACRINPKWKAYVKSRLRTAVRDLKVDMIHFDNFDWASEPAGDCHCPVCAEGFRRFLADRYTPAERRARFGFEEIGDIVPPHYPQGRYLTSLGYAFENGPADMGTWAASPPPWLPPHRVLDPLHQDWLEFRCAGLADSYGELADYIRSLDPDVAVELNPTGITGLNNARSLGVDHDRLLRHGDVFWSEESSHAHVDAEGRLVSCVRSHRLARTTGNKLLLYCRTPLTLAESMAFGNGCLGCVGIPDAETRRYVEFFRARFAELYAEPRSAARVALWRGTRALMLDNFVPHRAAVLAEQALIQGHRPYDLLLDGDLARLGEYRAVIVPGMTVFDPENEEMLRAYLAGGGGIVLLEESGFHDGRLRRRKTPAFARELGLSGEYPRPPEGRLLVRTAGGGRIAYLPEVRCARFPRGVSEAEKLFGGHRDHWFMPDNAAEILDALRWAAGEEPEIAFDGPETLVLETSRPKGGGVVVHLVNYRPETPPGDLVVRFGPALLANPRSAVLHSPDRPEPVRLPLRKDGDRVEFTIEGLRTYDAVLIRGPR